MKKGFLLVALLLVIFSGCGGDDTPANVVDPELVGIWRATSFIVSNCEDESNNESNTNLVCTSFECIQFEFTDDSEFEGRTIVNDFETRSNGTYSADNGMLSIVSGAQALTGSYSIANNVLSYNYSAGGCDIAIVMDKFE